MVSVRDSFGHLWPREHHLSPDIFRFMAQLNGTAQRVNSIRDSFNLGRSETVRDFIRMIVTEPARGINRGQLIAAAGKGFPLLMVPSKHALEEILDTGSYEESLTALFEHRDIVLERCRVMVEGRLPTDFSAPAREALTGIHLIAREAIRMFQGEQYIGAQATATAAFDSLLTIVMGAEMSALGHDKHLVSTDQVSAKKVLSHLQTVDPDADDEALAAELIIQPALTAFDKVTSDSPIYNRHSTMHRASPTQYTPDNALLAVMNMASICTLMRCLGPDAVGPKAPNNQG